MRTSIATALLAILMAIACARANERDIIKTRNLSEHDGSQAFAVTEYRAYHPNGVVKARGTLFGRLRVGLWVYADEQGFICGYEDIRPDQTNVAKGQLFVIDID